MSQDERIKNRYERFIARLKYLPAHNEVIPIWKFRDCMNLGQAQKYAKKGHFCFEGTNIIPEKVFSLGFVEEDIALLFSTPQISKKRKQKLRLNKRKYRARRGAIGQSERRRRNVEDYKKIIALRKKRFTRVEISEQLGIPLQRIRYLIQIFKER